MRRLRAVWICGLFVLVGVAPVQAQSLSEDQIFEALKPKPITRSLAPTDANTSSERRVAIENVKAARTRGLSISQSERDKLAEISKDQPSTDLSIPFDFNSAQLKPKAVPLVRNLGAALTRSEIKGRTFIIAGHTDAKGDNEFNQKLSERRAEAVRQYLVKSFKIPAETLVAVGHGESQLKNASDPLAAENRRVQVVRPEI